MKKNNLWILNQFWTKVFLISHISGWTIAFLQTFWIVHEVRKIGNKATKKRAAKNAE